MEEIIFVDFHESSCMLKCAGSNLCIWPSGDGGYIEITANQARAIAKALNFWAVNGE
jgi:(2Fe-2S) ferredoxin